MPGSGARKKTGKVLVLGQDNRSFLSAIRSLGRRGLQVHVGWFRPDSVALFSRYVEREHYIPPFDPEDDSWLISLTYLQEREDFDLVIPCHDRNVIAFQSRRQELERFGNVYLLGEEAYQTCFNKLKTNELARSLGIPVPREIVVSETGQAETVLSEFKLPVVLKPIASQSLERPAGRAYVQIANSPEEVRSHLASMLARGEVLAQEHLRGDDVDLMMVACEGEVLFAFQQVRIGRSVMTVQGSRRRSVEVSTDLKEACGKFVKDLDYTGVIDFDLLVDKSSGEWALMEANGRFSGSLGLALACGADIPYFLYQLLVEGKKDFPQDYQTGVLGHNLLMELFRMRLSQKADQPDSSLGAYLLQVARELPRMVLQDRSDTLVLDDPMPGLVELWRLAKTAVGRPIPLP